MNTIRLWFKAVRPYAYSASVIPVALGGLYARMEAPDRFSVRRMAAALAGGVLMHTAANLWNDYFDYRHGVDRPGAGEGSGVLVRGEMTPGRCFHGAVLSAALGGLAGLWLVMQTGWPLLLLIGLGLLGALAYAAGSWSPKHHALGEVWVFLLMGAGMPLGGYMAQTGRFSWGAVAAGIPAGLLMTLLLYANNLRDIQGDREAGLRTLPMRFRPVEAKVLAGLFLVAPYLMTTAMAATGQVPFATQAALLTLPLAVRWFWKVWTGSVTDGLVKGMALLHLAFGLLFAAGLWMGR